MQAIKNPNEFFILNGVKIYKETIINLSELTIEKAIELAKGYEKIEVRIMSWSELIARRVASSLTRKIDLLCLRIAKIIIFWSFEKIISKKDSIEEKLEKMEWKNFIQKFPEDELYKMFLQYPNKDDERLVAIREYYTYLNKRQANYIRDILVENNKLIWRKTQ